MLKLHLRSVQKKELQTLRTISVQTFKETFGNQNTEENMTSYFKNQLSQKQIEKEFEEPNTDFYFAFCNKELIGYLKLNFNGIQKKVDLQVKAFEIERIYILKAHQRKGLGSQLFAQAIEIGRHMGYQLMWLGVWEFNYHAIKFYETKGLRVFDSHIFVLGKDMQTDFLMKLKL